VRPLALHAAASRALPAGAELAGRHRATGATHMEVLRVPIVGIVACLIQQVLLGTRPLAPSVATRSVMNPFVSAFVGILPVDDTLSEPTWHKVVAWSDSDWHCRGDRDLARERDSCAPHATPVPWTGSAATLRARGHLPGRSHAKPHSPYSRPRARARRPSGSRGASLAIACANQVGIAKAVRLGAVPGGRLARSRAIRLVRTGSDSVPVTPGATPTFNA
jgi:hypothetical protein